MALMWRGSSSSSDAEGLFLLLVFLNYERRDYLAWMNVSELVYSFDLSVSVLISSLWIHSVTTSWFSAGIYHQM